jgi:uncharacterized protein (TIGR00297 family)
MPAYRLIAIALATNGITSLWTSVAVTLAFTALARWIRGVSRSGAAAGAIVCFLLIAGAGLGAFAGLITVFALTWIATRFGYRRKEALGIAERAEGRKASQVSANLGVAAGCAILYWISHRNSLFLVALVAALSEAAADTVSSELGQAANREARLITSWKVVPAGTNGGVSTVGTLSGIAAAALTTAICVVSGLLPWHYLPNCLGGAVVGMFIDSLLGASLERQGHIGNDAVNFFSTLMAALLAGGSVLLFSAN